MLIRPVSVVKFELTFLSLLCWGTPLYNCSIVCIAISVIPADQLKGCWIWDPILSGILYGQGSLKYKDKQLGFELASQRKYIAGLESVMSFQKCDFCIAKKPMRPYFFCIIPCQKKCRILKNLNFIRSCNSNLTDFLKLRNFCYDLLGFFQAILTSVIRHKKLNLSTEFWNSILIYIFLLACLFVLLLREWSSFTVVF